MTGETPAVDDARLYGRIVQKLDKLIVVLSALLLFFIVLRIFYGGCRRDKQSLPEPFKISFKPITIKNTSVSLKTIDPYEAAVAESLFVAAAASIDKGNLERAASLLKRARAINPNDHRFELMLESLKSLSERRNSEAALSKAIASDKLDEAWNVFARRASCDHVFFDRWAPKTISFLEKHGAVASAVSVLRTHLKRKPSDKAALATWCRLSCKLGYEAGVMP